MRRQIARGATDPLRASIWLAFLLAGAVLASIAEGQTAAGTAGGHARAYDVRTYGAKGDGRTIDTRSIQEAIRAAHAVGGGRVIFPPGTYVSGTIELLSNVTLELEAGSLLLGSSNLADYGSISQYALRTNMARTAPEKANVWESSSHGTWKTSPSSGKEQSTGTRTFSRYGTCGDLDFSFS